jgi:hypothetical protein
MMTREGPHRGSIINVSLSTGFLLFEARADKSQDCIPGVFPRRAQRACLRCCKGRCRTVDKSAVKLLGRTRHQRQRCK